MKYAILLVTLVCVGNVNNQPAYVNPEQVQAIHGLFREPFTLMQLKNGEHIITSWPVDEVFKALKESK